MNFGEEEFFSMHEVVKHARWFESDIFLNRLGKLGDTGREDNVEAERSYNLNTGTAEKFYTASKAL